MLVGSVHLKPSCNRILHRDNETAVDVMPCFLKELILYDVSVHHRVNIFNFYFN